ncbi:hypothetical protein RRG08_059355 [Elysia crispata]|uniref:Uncharacterized protein n=1 Tax=Elysia crispata TaxID=231223 RepID=A0AAE1BEK1_9GAST|nr:hypothetical protein RRG08_059355 [Elysia crispata]
MFWAFDLWNRRSVVQVKTVLGSEVQEVCGSSKDCFRFRGSGGLCFNAVSPGLGVVEDQPGVDVYCLRIMERALLSSESTANKSVANRRTFKGKRQAKFKGYKVADDLLQAVGA